MLNNPGLILMFMQSVLLFQIVYIFFQWIFIRSKEYLYYLTYIFITAIYIFFLLGGEIPAINDSPIMAMLPYLSNTLPITSFFFYYRFARHFVDLKKHFPRLRYWVIGLEYLLLSYVIIELIFRILNIGQDVIDLFYLAISVLLFVSSIVIIILFLSKRVVYTYFIVTGAIIMNFGAFGSFILLSLNKSGRELFIDMHPFLPYGLAIVFELLCFTTGLAYKARKFIIEKNEAKLSYINELNQKLELRRLFNEEMNIIASELHEKVANVLGKIEIQSSFAKKAHYNKDYEKSGHFIENLDRLSKHGHEITDELIWSINPNVSQLRHLVEKTQLLCLEQLSPLNIICDVKFDQAKGQMLMKKKTLLSTYRLVKAMINISKDVLPGEFIISISIDNDLLEIDISGIPFSEKIRVVAEDFEFSFRNNELNNGFVLSQKITTISD
jgi:glucose-6-phosphate-specific signal transduction histidine kinase